MSPVRPPEHFTPLTGPNQTGQRTRDISQKTIQMNSDRAWYGTLAEIGGGQETARWFFQVGRASGTVAKSMSAYDMAFSDAIYGRSRRYVSRERLIQMLNHEYNLLIERLDHTGGNKRLFAFANTIATRSHRDPDPGRGWLGVRFQLTPHDEPSQILAHIQLHDSENVHQQIALGMVGVNLIYGAFALCDQPQALVDSLIDCLHRNRVEIDMIHFEGPVAQGVDNRLMSLRLVEQGLTDAAMFTSEGRSVQPAEQLYNQPVLVQRGTFHPLTWPIVHMLERAEQRVAADEGQEIARRAVILNEMNLPELTREDDMSQHELLLRMEVLQALGRDVLISNFREHFRLTQLLRRYTSRRIGLVAGAATLPTIFDPDYYDDLAGGLLEAMGRLFKRNVRFYIYPYRDRKSGELMSADNPGLAQEARELYQYLRSRGAIEGLEPDPRSDLSVFPDDVRRMIHAGDPQWQQYVPEVVAEAIRKHELAV